MRTLARSNPFFYFVWIASAFVTPRNDEKRRVDCFAESKGKSHNDGIGQIRHTEPLKKGEVSKPRESKKIANQCHKSESKQPRFVD